MCVYCDFWQTSSSEAPRLNGYQMRKKFQQRHHAASMILDDGSGNTHQRRIVKTGMNVGKFGINVEKNGTKKVHF